MEKFIITGGKKLEGSLEVKGAKNHALKVIPACFLSKNATIIDNVPKVEDVMRLLEIIESIGGKVKWLGKNKLSIKPSATFSGQLPKELVPKLRASLVLLGPLLARYKKVELPRPGGCNLGKRPINFFIDGFKTMGAECKQKGDAYEFNAKNGLQATEFIFPRISVTGTETLMLAAVLAKGKTVLKNAACEPEVTALAQQLKKQGVKISGIGTQTLTIVGSKKLLPATKIKVIPDRIEAGSFAILAAATKSHLKIKNCEPKHLETPLLLLKQIGIKFKTSKNSIEILPSKKNLQALNITTHEYPGLPTDLQAPMTVLLTAAKGDSLVRETIYEGRLLYTDTLNAMGADICLLDSYRALVKGPTKLRGKKVASPDIRAGIALVIAALMAKGETTIENIYQVDRGYENIDKRLQDIGANIKRTIS